MTIRIWDAEIGAVIGEPLNGHTGVVWSVAYSPDGRHIISGSDDKTIRIWDVATNAVVGRPLEGEIASVLSIAFFFFFFFFFCGKGRECVMHHRA